MAGEEVVQMYLKSSNPGAPIRSLEGFDRVSLRPGERKTVSFQLQAAQFAYTANGHKTVAPGAYEITVGGGQPGPNTVTVAGSVRLAGSRKELN
jgi:beta-glucosidase